MTKWDFSSVTVLGFFIWPCVFLTYLIGVLIGVKPSFEGYLFLGIMALLPFTTTIHREDNHD
jgi:hypothetical protein